MSEYENMRTADIVAEALIDWKVDIIFGLPGDGINGFIESLRRRQDKLKFVLVTHEESAAFMACAIWDSYLTNHTNAKDPTVSPLQASVEQLKGLPPALIINGENDVLRDEGEAYALKLLEAGVPVTAVRYHGTIHDFVLLNVIADDPSPRAAIEQASIMLKNVLSE
jgi:acetyl esterase/lipase